MARRNGRKGSYLFTDYYTDVAVYSDKVQRDYWGDYTAGKMLLRNLQEVSVPLNDPYPVPIYSGPSYEQTSDCIGELTPLYIGNTTRPFPQGSAASQAFNLDPGIGAAAIGCTFRVN